MKTLIVEDDVTSRLLLQTMVRDYGPVHAVANGRQAVAAVQSALDAGEPYDLICLDIMMPEMDGQQALREIRALDARRDAPASRETKIVMTTALDDELNVSSALGSLCDDYLVKPVDRAKLETVLQSMGLIIP